MSEDDHERREPVDPVEVREAIKRDFGEDAIERLRAPVILDVSLAAIEAFVIAAEHATIADAANACGLKEDTLRKRLDALEAWAKVSLMQRRPSLVLTRDGERFLPFAELACAAMRSFHDLPSGERGRNILLGTVRKPPSGSHRVINKPSRRYVEVD